MSKHYKKMEAQKVAQDKAIKSTHKDYKSNWVDIEGKPFNDLISKVAGQASNEDGDWCIVSADHEK